MSLRKRYPVPERWSLHGHDVSEIRMTHLFSALTVPKGARLGGAGWLFRTSDGDIVSVDTTLLLVHASSVLAVGNEVDIYVGAQAQQAVDNRTTEKLFPVGACWLS